MVGKPKPVHTWLMSTRDHLGAPNTESLEHMYPASQRVAASVTPECGGISSRNHRLITASGIMWPHTTWVGRNVMAQLLQHRYSVTNFKVLKLSW